MKPEHSDLYEKAHALPPEARAALAASLIDSLDGEIDEGAEEAWAVEVEKRVRELRAGKVTKVPWSEARRRIVGD